MHSSSALNHVYRLVWSDHANAHVAVAEHTSGGGGKSRAARALVVSALLGAASSAHGQANVLPTAGRIVAGSGAIAQNGSTMTVTQGSDRLVVDWNSFDIGARSGVRFAQPDSGSIALNRVTGSSASSILGRLSANGQVWLINPNGVVFGSSAQVDVGGLVASSLALSNGDFLAGRSRFTDGTGAGAVVNRGFINASGGVVALLGPQVRNEGSITTTGGSTVLAAGDRVSLDFSGDGLVSVNIDRSVVDALAGNSGRISADGGLVVLSARSANKALDSVVNNTGIVEAKGLVARSGRILLDGDAEQGSTHVAGTLDVSSAAGRGGTITITGHDIALDHGATLDASGAAGGGDIRVGGGFQGKDADIANAANVVADGSVTARADATGNGNGGNIVFWSDDATRFAGQLSVRGGVQGGDGGAIEVSGKQDLSYSGRADARAPLGRTGDLLLDPATVTVSGGGTGSGAITGTTVFEKDLEAQNANVLLQATGNVTFNDLALNGGDGTISMANNVSLRVEGGTGTTSAASGNISFTNAANTIEVSGTGSLLFIAGSLGTGNIVNAPNLTAHGTGTNPTTLPTHTVTTVGSGTPSAGSITLFGADGVTVGGSVTTNGGYFRVWADSDNAGGGGYTSSAPVSTNGGNFYVSAGTGAILLNSNMTLGAGRIQFQADGTYTTGARTLGGVLSASGAVNINTPLTMNAGAGILTDGVVTFSNTVNLNTGSGALTLRASAIDFTAATLSNLSTASLILQPADPSTSMVLGDANGFASATTLAKLPGIKNLTIGRTDGTGSTSVASNFSFAATGMLEVVNRTIAITGGTLTNTAGNVTLTGDTVNISRQVTANAGNGSATLRQLTASNPINLGTDLPNSVLGQINAATLAIGRSDGGDVTFASNIATTASTVHLLSGGQVIGTAGGVSAANLAINAGTGVTLNAPAFNFTKLALAVGGPTTIAQTQGGFAIAAVDGVTGLAIAAGSNANVTLSSPGAITATGTLALNANTSLLTLNATSVDLSSSTVSGATNASFALKPLNASDNLTLGATSGFASAATLGKLTNSRNVTVGRSDGSGLSTVSNFFSLSASGTLELINGQVTLSGSVYNNGGSVKLTALAGNLVLNNANVTAASGQLTLSATGASVSGTGIIIAPSLLVSAPAAAVALNGSSNNVGTIAGNAGSLSFVDTASLVVGTVGGVNGVNAAGSLVLRTTGTTADLTLNQAVSGSASGDAVVLAAGRNFVDNSGASAISAAGGGRWLVYSGSPTSDTRGGLAAAFKQYNAPYGTTVLGGGNGFVYRVAPAVTIGLTGATGKVYDGNTTATLAAGNYLVGGAIDGDAVAFASTGASYASKGVGSGKSVSANGLSLTGASNGAATVYGYQLTGTTATGNIGQITPALLTVGLASVADKVYDTTTTASVNGVALTGVLGSDAIGTSATGTFANRNVGSGKAVVVSGVTLTGADAGNYVLSSQTTSGVARITPATLTIGAADVVDKVYDGTTVASVRGVALGGVLGNDAIGTTASGAFADKNVAVGKSVTVSGVALTGADAGNYVLSSTNSSGTASITPATLTVGTAAVADKVYDATTSASVTGIALTGVFGGDAIGTTATGVFADKNVGTGKAVTVSGVALTGADAGNYRLASTNASGLANVAPATLTVGAATIADKVYDATTAASVGAVALNGVLGRDLVGANATGTFTDKNVGNRKAVALDAALTGADAGNYVLASGAYGTASIAPALLTVGGAGVADKVYDATTRAMVSGVTLTGVFGGDAIGTTASGAFANRNVGNGKAVSVSGVALTGADAANYVLDTTISTGTASIRPATLTVGGADVADKVYDATTLASVNGVALTGVFDGDAIGTTAAGRFANKNVGSGKFVSVDAVVLTGADAANYVLDTTTSVGSASIRPAPLSVGAATVADKIYDATTGASVSSVALSGVIGNDLVGTTATGNFANKNVGNGKVVTVGGIALTGVDAANYSLDATGTSGRASITPATLTVGVAAVADKVYDGNRTATVGTVDLSGVMSGDRVVASASGRFADAEVGVAKPVAVSGIALGGVDAGNYSLASTATTGRANIDPPATALAPIPAPVPASVTPPVPDPVVGATLAALTSPQVRSNGTADKPDTTGAAASIAWTVPDAAETAVTRGLPAPGSTAGTITNPAVRSDPSSNALPAKAGNAILTSPMVDVPDTLLTAGGRYSIAVGAPEIAKPVAASLPVYSVAPGVPLHGEGQFVVTDDGATLSLTPDGDAQVASPSLTQRVSGSAHGLVPLSTGSVEMRVDLLPDRTLVATIPEQGASQATEALAAFGLVVAKSGLSIGVDAVRAIVLRFEPPAPQPGRDGPGGAQPAEQPRT